MRYLTATEVIAMHDAECGNAPVDFGLLESAVLRPQTTVGGQDAYPTLHEKAAAMLHSLTRNHAFTDGNKRTALIATIIFYGMNGHEFVADDGTAIALVIDVAEGQLDAPAIAKRLDDVVIPMTLPEADVIDDTPPDTESPA